MNVTENCTFYAPEGFFKAQIKTKAGFYTLKKIKLSEIDVVFKGIASRKFFHWDSGIDKYIDDLKANFEKTPPIILEYFEGKYYSVDGHHRLVAATELEKKNILAFVIEVDKLTYPRNN